MSTCAVAPSSRSITIYSRFERGFYTFFRRRTSRRGQPQARRPVPYVLGKWNWPSGHRSSRTGARREPYVTTSRSIISNHGHGGHWLIAGATHCPSPASSSHRAASPSAIRWAIRQRPHQHVVDKGAPRCRIADGERGGCARHASRRRWPACTFRLSSPPPSWTARVHVVVCETSWWRYSWSWACRHESQSRLQQAWGRAWAPTCHG